MISDHILRKIERYLMLFRSANEHGAGTAPRQTQRLMTEHGISEIEAGRKPLRWLDRLATLVNAAFGTSAVYEPRPIFSGWQDCFTKIRHVDAYTAAWLSDAFEHLIPIEKSEDALTAIEHFKTRFYSTLENLYVIDRGQCRDDQKTMMKGYVAGRNARFYSGVEQERRGGTDSWLRS